LKKHNNSAKNSEPTSKRAKSRRLVQRDAKEVLADENPERFAKSRDVGPYLGLVPKQEDSGESQPQLGISKAGDTMVRRLLVPS
jgi:transposase